MHKLFLVVICETLKYFVRCLLPFNRLYGFSLSDSNKNQMEGYWRGFEYHIPSPPMCFHERRWKFNFLCYLC